MGYPKDLLTPGEEIAFELKPHWRSLIPALLFGLIILFATFFLWAKMNDFGLSEGTASTLRWIVLAVGLACFAWFTGRHLAYWYSTQYVFTNRRIIVRSGVMRKVGRDMPLDKLNNVSFSQSLTERMFASGQLVVESGSEMGNLIIKDVPSIEHVQREVYRLMQADAGRYGMQAQQAPMQQAPIQQAPVQQAPAPAPAAPAQQPADTNVEPYVEGDTTPTRYED